MICGVGVDIADIERVRRLLTRGRERTLGVIFGPAEIEHARAIEPLREPGYVAGRLAAKEAVLKALGTGLGPASFHEVVIEASTTGRPGVLVQGRAARLAEELGIERWHLSISHERGAAVAVAVAEGS
jgi:holo-[acyl-carrier protein] synthase